jgi:hypothetical protein
MCVSDCDGNGLLTSCHHFVCTRCVAKYPAGTCPRCQRPCQALRVSSANVASRVSTDGVRSIAGSVQVLEFQRRQDAVALQRLKELVAYFNNQHRAAAAKVQELSAENAALHKQLEHAQRAHAALQARLAAHGGGGGASPYGMPPAVDAAGGYSPPAAAYPPPGGTTWPSPVRPPSVTRSDVNSIFGQQRCRTAGNGAVTPLHGGLVAHSPADRFRLATPAVTLCPQPGTDMLRQPAAQQPRSMMPPLRSMLPTLASQQQQQPPPRPPQWG